MRLYQLFQLRPAHSESFCMKVALSEDPVVFLDSRRRLNYRHYPSPFWQRTTLNSAPILSKNQCGTFHTMHHGWVGEWLRNFLQASTVLLFCRRKQQRLHTWRVCSEPWVVWITELGFASRITFALDICTDWIFEGVCITDCWLGWITDWA